MTGHVLMLGQKSVEHAFTVTQHIRTWSEMMYLKEALCSSKIRRFTLIHFIILSHSLK